MSDTPRLTRRAFTGGLLAALAGLAAATAVGPAAAQTYYDAAGTVIVINPATLTAPRTVYNAYGQPVLVYPTHPGYVPGPVYGPAGIRGQSRRVARRSSRRVSRRR